MLPISYARHQFPPVVIQHAVWLYLRFTLSYRDVEDLLAERGLDISHETVRSWVLKFGPVIARRLRRPSSPAQPTAPGRDGVPLPMSPAAQQTHRRRKGDSNPRSLFAKESVFLAVGE